MTTPTSQRKAKLNDGHEIPVLGLGTYLSLPNEVTQAVVAGWKTGIRHFDCAQFYKVHTVLRVFGLHANTTLAVD